MYKYETFLSLSPPTLPPLFGSFLGVPKGVLGETLHGECNVCGVPGEYLGVDVFKGVLGVTLPGEYLLGGGPKGVLGETLPGENSGWEVLGKVRLGGVLKGVAEFILLGPNLPGGVLKGFTELTLLGGVAGEIFPGKVFLKAKKECQNLKLSTIIFSVWIKKPLVFE